MPHMPPVQQFEPLQHVPPSRWQPHMSPLHPHIQPSHPDGPQA
jgi:hypothetical protein